MNKNIKLINSYYFYFTDLLKNMEHKKYCYMDTESWLGLFVQGINDGCFSQSMQTYWKEILLRAHFSSVTSIIRNKKWLEGVMLGIDNQNLMIFAASLRGFLESVTDSDYSIESLPTSLSLNYKNISKAIKGELEQHFISEELENKLIHYQFAARSKEKYDNPKKALTSAKYIDRFDMYSDKKTKELYSLLCEITHPASRSVSCFMEEKKISDVYSYSVTSTTSDNAEILEIIEKYINEILELIKISLFTPFICLKILLMYDFEEVQSKYINRCEVNNVIRKEGWNQIKKMMDMGEEYLDSEDN